MTTSSYIAYFTFSSRYL